MNHAFVLSYVPRNMSALADALYVHLRQVMQRARKLSLTSLEVHHAAAKAELARVKGMNIQAVQAADAPLFLEDPIVFADAEEDESPTVEAGMQEKEEDGGGDTACGVGAGTPACSDVPEDEVKMMPEVHTNEMTNTLQSVEVREMMLQGVGLLIMQKLCCLV